MIDFSTTSTIFDKYILGEDWEKDDERVKKNINIFSVLIYSRNLLIIDK